MIYLKKSKQSKNKKFLFSILITVLIVAGIACLQIFFGDAVGRAAISAGRPFSTVYIGAKDNLAFVGAIFSSRSRLVEENRNLKEKIADDSAKLVRFDSLLNEHQELLESYGRNTFSSQLILANVTASPPQSPYDVLIVDVGSREGVSANSRVYGLGGIPIGKIGEVASKASKVVLFSTVGQDNQAVIERTSTLITLKGTGGGNMESEVAQEMDVIVGDSIVLPEFGGAVVAKVVDVESSVTSAFKTVLVRAPVNVFNLRWVEIEKS